MSKSIACGQCGNAIPYCECGYGVKETGGIDGGSVIIERAGIGGGSANVQAQQGEDRRHG